METNEKTVVNKEMPTCESIGEKNPTPENVNAWINKQMELATGGAWFIVNAKDNGSSDKEISNSAMGLMNRLKVISNEIKKHEVEKNGTNESNSSG